MLRKLRIKFIALNMITIAAVIIVVFSTICAINYQQNVSAVYSALESSLSYIDTKGQSNDPGPKNDSSKPESEDGDSTTASDSTSDGNAATASDPTGDSTPSDVPADPGKATAPQIGGKPAGGAQHIPIAIYSLGDDGSYEAMPTIASASIADEVLTQAIEQVGSLNDGQGKLSDLGLFYQKKHTNSGNSYVAFADVSAASGWQSLAITLTIVGLGTLAVFFVISLFFSKWALKPVRNAWVQQRQFVADASHELKTPLTVILANTSILMSHPERTVASQSQWIESTQAEGERMQGLVGDLLLLARMDAEETEVVQAKPTERVDLSNLVEGELLQFESVAFERAITLDGQVDEGIFVQGASERLRRLATTLLDNACKYANQGGTVDVRLCTQGGKAVLTVHNTGPSISPDDLEHVFDRFYRADKARSGDVGGYGLGLSIAREVCEEHGGSIAAASSDAAGTTFTATLPLKK